MSGITYYKLSKDIYPGDTTKGCGLTGPEIDANFHFLRGYDIKDGELNPENGIITLYRFNGEKIEIEGLAELLSGLTDFNLDESYYDPSEGALHLFVNGEEQSTITGFFTHADIHVDCTLEGDGSEENLLRISKKFIDGVHNEVKDAVDKERREREEADKNLNDKISNEIERAKNAESELAENFNRAINAEKEERIAADNALYERLDEEKSSREELDDALQAEVERAKSAENEIAQSLSREIERAQSSERALGESLQNEKTRAEEKESELQSKIEAETERAKGAESGLTEEIATEKQRATEAEGNLQQEIESEKNRATEKENELDDKINNVKEDLQTAVSSLTDEIASAVTDLKEEIDAERSERESAVTDLTQAISDAKEELSSAITEEKSERESQIEEIKEDIAELDSAFTESLSEISSETSAITDSINELEKKVTDVTLTKDVVISESSPLYPFISGIWPDNIINEGTTFTDFVEKLCSEDIRMIYYIDTPLSDIDDAVETFDSIKKTPTGTGATYITATEGSHIVGVALPKPHVLVNVVATVMNKRIIDKFYANSPREFSSNDIVYTLYYYRIPAGQQGNDLLSITIA